MVWIGTFRVFTQDIEKRTEWEHKALKEGKGDSDLSLFSFPLDWPGDLNHRCKSGGILREQEWRHYPRLEPIFLFRVAVRRVDGVVRCLTPRETQSRGNGTNGAPSERKVSYATDLQQQWPKLERDGLLHHDTCWQQRLLRSRRKRGLVYQQSLVDVRYVP
jgi:hypothetical protein